MARGQGYTLFLTPGRRGTRPAKRGSREILPNGYALSCKAPPPLRPSPGRNSFPARAIILWGTIPRSGGRISPLSARVRYQQVYPGVDLIYYGRQGRLENDFEVTAGTNPKVISWRLEGAERIRVDSTGDLVLTVGGSEVRLQQPRAYQLDGEQQREIPIRYRVHGQKVSFALGKYNRHQKLVIDPVLTYSTYLGGTGGDTAYSVAVDSAGDAYVTGVTASTNFPTTSSAYQATYAGDGDVFVTKFNPTGTGVLFSTYLGGSGIDTPSQILLDACRGHLSRWEHAIEQLPHHLRGLSTELCRQSGRFLDRDETGRLRFNLLHLHRWYGDRFRHCLDARFVRGRFRGRVHPVNGLSYHESYSARQ